MTPSETVAGVRAHEAPAEESLFRIVQAAGWNAFRGRSEREDWSQDTYLAVWGAIVKGQVLEPARLLSYVAVVALNVLRDRLRKVETHPQAKFAIVPWDGTSVEENLRAGEISEEHWALTDGARDPEECAIERELVAQSLRPLRGRSRDIVVRFYLMEHEDEATAKTLGLCISTVKVLRFRALRRMRLVFT